MNRTKKILVIDDETEILKLLEQRLKTRHYACITADNPIDGLQKAAREKPDLILLDLMLPKMSGLGFLRIATHNPEIAYIPIVVLTALKDGEVAQEALETGARDYLTKDCDTEELFRTIEKWI